jgi:4-diphosphocytidyl-2-C-methyl-D-erythritol kinase
MRAAARPAVLTAPAKLTLSLRIVGRRPDGYHLLESEMVSIDLADELTFTEGDGLEVVDGGAPGPAGPGGVPGTSGMADTAGMAGAAPPRWLERLPRDDDNLVRRALRATGRTAHVRLAKRIPPGAGLGGGSADAAAVLRWAGVDDVALAASLGADVPFCLRGGRALVRGIGEEVEHLPDEARTFTLVVPPFGCSTPAVYRAWDDLGARPVEGPNHLEAAALAVEPRLAWWRDELAAATGVTPRLAGSGSTWFVEGAFPGEGRIVTRTVPALALPAIG